MTETVVEYKAQSQELDILEQVKSLRINSEEGYDKAAALKISLKNDLKLRLDKWEPLRAKAYESYQEVLTNMKAECSDYEKGIKICQNEMDRWATEQRRIVQEKQARLEAEARKKAEDERQKLLDKAVKAEEKGDIKKAEILVENAEDVFAEPVFVQAELPKGTKRDIEIKVLNLKLMCAEIANGHIPETLIKVDEQKLKKWVLACNKRKNDVPGLFIHETCKTSVRI
jgi:membrane protein involved in colicin uptake